MTRRRIRGWKFWLVGVPAMLMISGVVFVAAAERSIAAEIAAEEKRLLAMGIDVRPVTSATNSFDAYGKLLATPPKDPIVLLEKLEAIAKMPSFAGVEYPKPRPLAFGDTMEPIPTLDRVYEVERAADKLAATSLAERNWPVFNRAFRFRVDFRRQAKSGNAGGSLEYSYFIGLAPPAKDSEATKHLIAALEAIDPNDDLKADLSNFGRIARYQPPPRKPNFLDVTWWREAAVQNRLFRLQVDLAKVRAVRSMAEDLLAQPRRGHGLFDTRFTRSLRDQQTASGTWAADHAQLANFQPGWSADRNEMLIYLDIAESQRTGKPIVPTWSKKYAYNPTSGNPIEVTGDQEGFEITGWARAVGEPNPRLGRGQGEGGSGP